jgi:selenide,water dikinase
MKGATDKAAEAGISIIGGHTIEDNEPKFGLVVAGTIHPGRILLNSGSLQGDLLILTKPIGGGILSTGLKRELLSRDVSEKLFSDLSQLNKTAAEVMARFPVHACTDVTGFGLLGHLKEMVAGSGFSAEVWLNKVPVMDEAWKLVTAGIIPGGTLNNMNYVEDTVVWGETIPYTAKVILCDAQTSGGLLIALPEMNGPELLLALKTAGLKDSSVIGRFTDQGRTIRVTD